MGLVPGQARHWDPILPRLWRIRKGATRLESAISICIIAILFVIGFGVFLRRFHYDMSGFGIGTDTEPNSGIPFELVPLAPAGFETFSEVEIYNPENLYQKINGKAPLYIESGFVKLYAGRFISKQDESLWMQLFVYDMGAIRNAFSVFSVQRRPDAVSFGTLDPQYAYRTSNGLYCVNGHYYIEVVGSAESNELFNAMVEVRNKLRKRLAVDKVTEIGQLSLFPAENIVAGSIKLYLANTFGFQGLTDTFTCQYRFGDQTITAFLSRRSDRQDAQAVAESYYSFLIDNGGVVKRPANETLRALEGRVIDFYGTIEIVFAVGPFVAGIHEAENQQSAEELAVKLINKLSEAAKNVNKD